MAGEREEKKRKPELRRREFLPCRKLITSFRRGSSLKREKLCQKYGEGERGGLRTRACQSSFFEEKGLLFYGFAEEEPLNAVSEQRETKKTGL